MAFTSYNSGSTATVIKKFDDISVDFPVNGVLAAVRAEQLVIISGTISTTVKVQITLDSADAIEAGTATWVDYATVGNTDNRVVTISIGGTGIKLDTVDTNLTAWIAT